MNHAAHLSLLTYLAEHLPDQAIGVALACRSQDLEELLANARATSSWGAVMALRHAHLWLVAGRAGRGDDLVLEADKLAPEAGLIPDWWSLWPRPASAGATEPREASRLAESYVRLRHLSASDAWEVWQSVVQAQPHRLDEPAMRLLLGLAIQGQRQLPESHEQVLNRLVGEDLVAAEPGLCWRFFDAVSERLPDWNYGRLKAADLSLVRGELTRCRQHLQGASEAQWQSAWMQDVAARLGLAEGKVAEALAAWQRAIERCPTGSDGAALLEIFRQRAREARRGPGVLRVRSLLNRGEREDALALLELLLEHDPHWQPLRSLREQAIQSGRQDAPGLEGAASRTGAEAAATGACGGKQADDLLRLQRRLQELAQRASLPWPEPADTEALASQDAAGFERFLQQALGRLALLG